MTKKRFAKLSYILVTILVGWGLPAIEYQFGGEMEFISEFSFQEITLFVLTALTFPAGALSIILAVSLMLAGLVSPWESLIIITPLMAALGYLQWFQILPRLYRRKSGMTTFF